MSKATRVKHLATLSAIALAAATLGAADWQEWRGPTRQGVSAETGLPASWSPKGENLVWRAPYGSRSTPIVMGNRVFMVNGAGEGDTIQERVMAIDADTGKVVWEHRYNVFHSDVPPHRLGWASPAGDPDTGNIYAFGVGALLKCLSRDGKVLWERSINEDFGAITTHGGRTVPPLIDGDLVIVSTLTSGWGEQARGSNRWFAFDKRGGELVWVSAPQRIHYDTNYSSPIVAEMNGTRMIIVGGTDGSIHALKVATGEPVWKYEISKRAILTNAVTKGTTVFVTHSEENIGTSEMGMVAAIDGTATGDIGKPHIKWTTLGFQGGFSSPVLDGDRLYEIDNGAVLGAFDVGTGKRLWTHGLGTIQKASPVLADGKLYAGTENGKFFILKPGPDKVEVLDEDWLGTEAQPEAIVASPAVSNGRVYVASMEALYAIGRKGTTPAFKPTAAPSAADSAAVGRTFRSAEPAFIQILPAETTIRPGETAKFRVKLFDKQGIVVADRPVTWTMEALKGEFAGGTFTAPKDSGGQAGVVKATLGSVTGVARLRVLPPLPFSENFDGITPSTGSGQAGAAPPPYWINSTGKFQVRDVEGNKVLVKLADNPFTKRARVYVNGTELSDYTTEVDVRALERRRQMGDAGVIAGRYILVLFGNSQRMELQPWQPATGRTVSAPFAWKADTWYRVKLRVENRPNGVTLVQGKAWAPSEPEPPKWTVEKTDKIGHRHGSPGIYADASAEIYFDNLKVTPNQKGS